MRATTGSRSLAATIAFLVAAVATAGAGAAERTAAPTEPAHTTGFFALGGQAAQAFRLPVDTTEADGFSALGFRFERHHQVAGPHAATVLGAKITVVRDEGGRAVMVAGKHYPAIAPTNRVALAPAAAAGLIDRPGRHAQTALLIGPTSGRHVYVVETRRAGTGYFDVVDAETGSVVDSFDTIAHDHDPLAGCGEGLARIPAPCGLGVAYEYGSPDDVKDLSGLTTKIPSGRRHQAVSADGRHEVYSFGDGNTARPTTDDDDAWTLLRYADGGLAQRAVTDAIYYTDVVDDMLLERLRFDFVAEKGKPFVAQVHRSRTMWTGTTALFSDGDQISTREHTALDTVGHEFGHGVTQLTADLAYRNESGAMHEAFSDILGTYAEFWAEASGREPAAALQPDWLKGEDVDISGADAAPGWRNLQDPEEDDDPDHYSELLISEDEQAHVHSNAGIVNHAFYLLANGGRNASCAAPGTHNADHCSDTDDTQDNDVVVTAVGIEVAIDIFFVGHAALHREAQMCDARASTEAAAVALFGQAAADATTEAWLAVGVTDAACEGAGDPDPGPGKGKGKGPKPKS